MMAVGLLAEQPAAQQQGVRRPRSQPPAAATAVMADPFAGASLEGLPPTSDSEAGSSDGEEQLSDAESSEPDSEEEAVAKAEGKRKRRAERR